MNHCDFSSNKVREIRRTQDSLLTTTIRICFTLAGLAALIAMVLML